MSALTFRQSTPSDTWTIQHNLGAVPAIDVIVNGQVLLPADVVVQDDNTIVVKFSSAQSGIARLAGVYQAPNLGIGSIDFPIVKPVSTSWVLNGPLTKSALTVYGPQYYTNDGIALTNTFKTGGKWYLEYVIVARPSDYGPNPGFARNSADAIARQLGESPDSWSLLPGGTMYHGGRLGASVPYFGVNDVVGYAVDIDAGKAWISKNGVFVGDPVAGTGAVFTDLTGTIYAACGPTGYGAVTGVFKNTTYAAPTGFSTWD